MAKIKPAELRTMLASERGAALSTLKALKLADDRTTAMNYYMGDMREDMPSLEGRSHAVSSDVYDAIEGLMPDLMEVFFGSDEIVRFEPTNAQDVEKAQQETDYVNHVFCTQNPGFMIMYTFVKDALLSKTGLVKCWWDEDETEERESFFNQSDDQYAMIVAQDDIEVVAHSQRPDENAKKLIAQQYLKISQAAQAQGQQAPPIPPNLPEPMIHDVTIKVTKNSECVRIEPIPPEEFGISRYARSIKEATYMFHEVVKTQADLINQGFDEDQINELPTYNALGNQEEFTRDTVDEHLLSVGGGDEEANKAIRPIRVTEHYVVMDYDGTGAAKYRVTAGGEDGELLYREVEDDDAKGEGTSSYGQEDTDEQPDGAAKQRADAGQGEKETGGSQKKKSYELAIERLDFWPLASLTPIPITHRFFGRSIADVAKDIQQIKTALIRATLDNQYIANNPQKVLVESGASDNTVDDLLTSRIGGIIRIKTQGALTVMEHPSNAQETLPLIGYFDQRLEQRTGVSKQGQGLDPDALQNQSATAAHLMSTAAQSRTRLIARILAETGIKDMFYIMHAIIRKYGSKPQTVKLRNKWVTVDPRDFKPRNEMTVEVGLGSGGRAAAMAIQMAILGVQKEFVQAGMTNVVTAENLYNSVKDLTRIAGKKDIDAYFTDPKNAPPAPQKPDPDAVKAEASAKADQARAQADIAIDNKKTDNQIAIANRKAALDEKLMQDQMIMEREKHDLKMAETVIKMASTKTKGADGTTSTSVDHSLIDKVTSNLKNRSTNAPTPRKPRTKTIKKNPDNSFTMTEHE